MFIIHGTYHWAPKRLAFRNDYCLACEARTTSVLIRTVDVIHLFWIPVLPIGVWSRWYCARCGRRPHEMVRTRRGFKIAGAVILALMTLAIWMPLPASPGDVEIIWAMRLGLPIALVFTIYSIFKHRPEPRLQEQLAAVPPFEGRICPLCGGQLLSMSELVCGQCGAEHRPLASAIP